MASKKPTLKIIRSPIVIDELDAIWRWNAEQYSVDHADAYSRYLRKCIDDLETNYSSGKTVVTRPDLRYAMIRRRASGHGHIVVYKSDETKVNVLHVFHTAQDWPAKLKETSP